MHRMDTKISKVLAGNRFPKPKTVENVRSFLGLAEYYLPCNKGFAGIEGRLILLELRSGA